MAQEDYVIADQTGISFLSDLNNTLEAIVTNNSGATEPALMYPYQWWADTNAGILKQRNSANNAWINVLTLSGIKGSDIFYNNSTSGLSATQIQAAIDEVFVLASNAAYLGTAIGDKISLPTHLSGIVEPPKDNANFRYILLTAGETGTGEYNETILTSETVTGSAPLLVATAVINLAASPINGLTVNLLNSEGRFIKPGTSSGTIANDQMQQITGTVGDSTDIGGMPISGGTSGILAKSGAFSSSGSEAANGPIQGGASSTTGTIEFDSADSVSARTGTSTDVKNIQHTYYMRIA
jgi:hypothetical protein